VKLARRARRLDQESASGAGAMPPESFCGANLMRTWPPGIRVAPLTVMASKRPILRALPAQHARSRELQREVASIVRRHFEEACERAWTDITNRFEARPLFSNSDPSTAAAQRATRALVTLLVNGLSRLALTALMLPSRGARRDRRRWTVPPPSLTAIPGGLRRRDHAADWPPDSPPSR